MDAEVAQLEKDTEDVEILKMKIVEEVSSLYLSNVTLLSFSRVFSLPELEAIKQRNSRPCWLDIFIRGTL